MQHDIKKLTLLNARLEFVHTRGAPKIHVRLAQKPLALMSALCGRSLPIEAIIYRGDWLTTDDLCLSCVHKLQEAHPTWVRFSPWTDIERDVEQRKAALVMEAILQGYPK